MQTPFKNILENLNQAIFRFSVKDQKFEYLSPAVELVTGFTSDEFSSDFVFLEKIAHSDFLNNLKLYLKSVHNGFPVPSFEFKIIDPAKNERWIIISSQVILDDIGNPTFIEGLFQDNTKYQKILEAVQENEAKYRSLFDNMIDGVALYKVLIDAQNNPVDLVFVEVNETFKDYGIDRDLVKWKKITKVIPAINTVEPNLIEKFGNVALDGQNQRFDFYFTPFERWFTVSAFCPQPGYVAVVYDDITDRKHAEEQLQKYAEKQKVLLSEVNHRVKNNLSAIIGMLQMEADVKIQENSETFEFVEEIITRIKGLATVHSLLSNSEWDPLNISYLCEQILQGALQGLPLSTKVNLTVKECDVTVDSTQAHHLTIIFNELATNSIKHALKDKTKADISLNIEQKDDQIFMEYRDDGPGFPQAMLDGDFSNVNIGFELVRGITRSSLRGQSEIKNDNGAVTTITFPIKLN